MELSSWNLFSPRVEDPYRLFCWKFFSDIMTEFQTKTIVRNLTIWCFCEMLIWSFSFQFTGSNNTRIELNFNFNLKKNWISEKILFLISIFSNFFRKHFFQGVVEKKFCISTLFNNLTPKTRPPPKQCQKIFSIKKFVIIPFIII